MPPVSNPKIQVERILWIILSILSIIFITLVIRQAMFTYQSRAESGIKQGQVNFPSGSPTTGSISPIISPIPTSPVAGCEAKKLDCRTRIKGIRRKQCCHVCTYQLADCSTTKKETCEVCTGICK